MILQYLFTNPQFFIVWIAAIVYAITVHEFSHALADYRLGDTTARDQGRLTLNPLAHLDPLGSVMLVLVGFGWGKPVPFNPYSLKNHRWGPAVISLAGPISNFVSVIIFGFALKFLVVGGHLSQDNLLTLFLVALVQVNIILGLFNLIPIPPLDGSKLLYSALSDKYIHFKIMLERYGSLILLAFILLNSFSSVSPLSSIFTAVTNFVFRIFS